MSTTPPATDRTFRQRWTDFWFAPGDPTTLGFIRIMTGLLALYIHLTYSLDLQAFFGSTGWYGTNYIEKERHEFPWMAPPFFEWDETNNPPRIPDFPHRRKAFMEFVRGLPEGKAERAAALRYFNRVVNEDPNTAVVDLRLLLALREIEGDRGGRPDERAAAERDLEVLTRALAEGRQKFLVDGRIFLDTPPPNKEPAPFFPDYLIALPPAERAAVANDLRAAVRALPADLRSSRYVVNHLMEDAGRRAALVEWLNAIPDDAAERKRLTDYLDYWSNDPRKTLRQGHGIVSVWFHVSDPGTMAAIHCAVLGVMVLFTVGFCTRVTSVLTWLAALSYVQRTNQILFGMDTMMNILLVYLMIGNSGAALSVDRLIARYRAVRASLRRSGTIDPATRAFLTQPPPSVGANFGIRLIQVHFCFIYLAAGLSKLKGAAWWNGTAFWDVMINPEFTLLRYSWFEDMMRAMVSVKPLYHAAMTLGVWFTWGLEIAFPFLIWTRLRPFMLWLAVLLHAGIGVLMGLNLFELLMMVMLLVYLPPGVIRDRLRGGPDLKKLAMSFNAADPKQARGAAAVAAVDVDAQVAVEPKKAERPTLTPAGAAALTGTAAVTALFADVRLLRFFRFLLWVPGVSGLLARLMFPGPASPAGAPRAGPPATAAAS